MSRGLHPCASWTMGVSRYFRKTTATRNVIARPANVSVQMIITDASPRESGYSVGNFWHVHSPSDLDPL